MNWPNSDSSSSPTGFSSETGACAERLIDSTSSGSMPVCSAISSGVGSRPELGDELALCAADLVELLDHVHGDADRARLVGERAGDRLADPPGGVGRELEALAVVELLRGTDQAERALLDQVEEGQALVAVVLRDRDDEPQVRLDHLLLRVEVAALDALGEVDLLLRREQPHLADVLQEQLKGVGRHVRLQVDRRLLAPAAAVDGALDHGRGVRGVVLDELDLGLLEVAVKLLDVALVELNFGERGGDLGYRSASRSACPLATRSFTSSSSCRSATDILFLAARRAQRKAAGPIQTVDVHSNATDSEVKRPEAEFPLTSQSTS